MKYPNVFPVPVPKHLAPTRFLFFIMGVFWILLYSVDTVRMHRV